MLLRYAFRYFGIRRALLLWYERDLAGTMRPTVQESLAFEVLDGERFYAALSRNLLPDCLFLTYRGASKIRYFQRKRDRRIDECIQTLQKGDVCIIGQHLGKVVGWIWVCVQGEKFEPTIKTIVHLDPTSSMVYRLYVCPGHQRQGFGTLLCEQALRYQSLHGYARSVALVENDNVPSKKAFGQLGFVPRKAIKCVRFITYSKRTEWDLPAPTP